MEEKHITGIRKIVDTAIAFLNEFKEFAPFGLYIKIMSGLIWEHMMKVLTLIK